MIETGFSTHLFKSLHSTTAFADYHSSSFFDFIILPNIFQTNGEIILSRSSYSSHYATEARPMPGNF